MSSLRIRFIGDVDERLRLEVMFFARWVRTWYSFPHPFVIRLVHQPFVTDIDGVKCAQHWWQTSRGRKGVVAEIAVASFSEIFKREGNTVAFPTVIWAVGRVIKYYLQTTSDSPIRVDLAEKWGDKLLEAYIEGSVPPYSINRAK